MFVMDVNLEVDVKKDGFIMLEKQTTHTKN